jgi:tRNA (guanine37-N1)-methyltransferase
VRLLPEVVGKPESLEEESFSSGLLEYPQYTRPQEWNGLAVPDVLLSGHHANIRKWRLQQAEQLTQERRPDLWAKYVNERKLS